MLEAKKKSSLGSPAFSKSNKVMRVLWAVIYYSLFRFSPVPLFSYRRFILRMFGAKIGRGSAIYPSVEIWLPSNLDVSTGVAIGPKSKIYNQGGISIGKDAIISQGAYLCASTHDYDDPLHPLLLTPISIGEKAWVCADAFIGPGVSVGAGAVIGARAVMTKDALSWCIYAGNPSVKLKDRKKF